MSFLVNLIRAEETEEILSNCTHVTNNWWIFEGDLAFLDGDYEHFGDGIVESLGGLSEKELINLSIETFNVKPSDFGWDELENRDMETRKDRITRLQKNEVDFNRLDKEDQEIIRELIPLLHVIYNTGHDWSREASIPLDVCTLTYRIEEDYQCEEELVKCTVYEKDGFLYFDYHMVKTRFSFCVDMPGFVRGEDSDGNTFMSMRFHDKIGDDKPAQWPKFVVFRA